ncbi:tumor necrosis factor receptor superfamily member 17 isoform X1 [Pangasianodon hypophthalmus]|uniref:tumor necrosis factor receptor superfamily member 17 isoform X1 n=1 Tax=Pangasianodon hypophthalmus TaxID=310915 RepID=UPI000EFFA519|nr:tumor necrosis factor receptor superfamily member 17 isoform X1 [Pangasianodon hypophthalmus]
MHWRKMTFHLWLLLYMTPVALAKCGVNSYYDGLIEDCQPCSIRCKSPPSICVTYCKSTTSSANEAGANRNIRVILIVLFVFLGAFITLTLIQVVRRKACRPVIKAKAQQQETSESDGGSETTEKSDDGSPDMEDGTCKTHCNTSLPLPSTEEGTTMLVTTKTVQTYNCRTQYTEDVTLGVWRTEMV